MSVAAGVSGSSVGPRRPVTTRRQSQRLESGRSTKPPPRAPLVRTPPPPRPALVPASVPNAARALVPGLARLGPKGLAAAALLLGGALLWGWLNSRNKMQGSEPVVGTYQVPTTSFWRVRGRSTQTNRVGTFCPGYEWAGGFENGPVDAPFDLQAYGTTLEIVALESSDVLVCGGGAWTYDLASENSLRIKNSDGNIVDAVQINRGGVRTSFNYRSVAPRFHRTIIESIEVNNEPAGFFQPQPDPSWIPPPLPLPDPEPAALPIPQTPLPKRPPIAPPGLEPLPVPGTLPAGDPSTSPAPGRSPVPAEPRVLPVPLAPVLPAPVGPQPGPDGTLQPQQPVTGPGVVVVPVPITEPGTEVFGPGVIGQPGQRPPATLDGIAGELGRIEQKLRALLPMIESPAIEFPEPPAEVDLAPVLELLEEISAELFAPYLGDGYELQGPCARDAEGNPLPPDLAEWSPGIGKLNRLGRQIDALALLMQYAKDQRQPICKGRPIGEEVSVNFIEVP